VAQSVVDLAVSARDLRKKIQTAFAPGGADALKGLKGPSARFLALSSFVILAREFRLRFLLWCSHLGCRGLVIFMLRGDRRS
jgi:hypothetical protein